MKKRSVIVHIGTEKTGTTSIQEFLSENRAGLDKFGIRYPSALGPLNHFGLCALAQDEQPKYDTVRLLVGAGGRQWTTVAAVLERSFIKEMEELPDNIDKVLFSNEHLHSNLIERSEIVRLKAFLGRFFSSIKIVVYLRRQDEVAHSLLSTRVKGGETLDQPVFPPVTGGLPYYFDYDAITQNYETVFGLENVIVRLFETSHLLKGDLIEDFFGTCDLPNPSTMRQVQRRNESLSRTALMLLSELNVYIPAYRHGQWNPIRNNLVETLENHCSGAAALCTRSEAKAFYEHCKATNERLQQRRFPALRGGLFSTVFDRYPETLEQSSPPLKSITEVVAHLWSAQREEFFDILERNRLLRFELAKATKVPPEQVEDLLRESISMLPNRAALHALYARWLAAHPSRKADALREARRAQQLMPQYPEYKQLVIGLT
ncbi:MAG: hypothetical protein ABL907_18890 [Hyphomicrobium sp.]